MKLLFLMTCVLCAFSVNCDTPDLPIERPSDIRTDIPPSDIVSPQGQTIIIVDEDPIIDSPPPPLPPPIADPGLPNELIARKLVDSNIDLSSLANVEPEKLNSLLDKFLNTVAKEGPFMDNLPIPPTSNPGTPFEDVVPDSRINQIPDSTFGVPESGSIDQQIDRLLEGIQNNADRERNQLTETPIPTPDASAPIVDIPIPSPDVPVPTVNSIEPTPETPFSDFPSFDTTELNKELNTLEEDFLRTSAETQLPDLRQPTLPPANNLNSVSAVIRDLEGNLQVDTPPSDLGDEFISTVSGTSLDDGFDSDQAKRLATLLEQRRELQRRLREQEQITLNSPAPNPLTTRRAPFRNINRAARGQMNFFDEFGNSIDDISSVSSPLIGNSIGVGRDIITDSESLQNNRIFDALAQAGRVNAPDNIRQRFTDDDGIRIPPPSTEIATRTQVNSASARIAEALRNDPYIMPGQGLMTDTSRQTRNDGILSSSQQQELNALLAQRQLLQDQLSRLSNDDIQSIGDIRGILPTPRNTRLTGTGDDDNRLPGRLLNFELNEGRNPLRSPQGTTIEGGGRIIGSSTDDGSFPLLGLGRLRQQNTRRTIPSSQTRNIQIPRRVTTDTFSEIDDIDPRVLGFQNRRRLSSLTNTRIGPVVGDTQRATPLSIDFRNSFVDTLPSSAPTSLSFNEPNALERSFISDDLRESSIDRSRARQNLLQSPRGTRQIAPFSTTTSSFLRTRLPPRFDRTPLPSSPVDLDDDAPPGQVGDTQSLEIRNRGREPQGFVAQTYEDFPDFNRQVAQLMRGATGFGSVSFRNFPSDDFPETFRTLPVGNIGNRRTVRFFRPQRRTSFSTRIF
ncbi:uncharacterized protein LOC134229698 [Saccostrea cucullata]|uniref:uncharacterized protein LOC134229698 n=1 Tax=Saccostrea cuccullata TaxID=36930 RepID=UPI002ED60DE3